MKLRTFLITNLSFLIFLAACNSGDPSAVTGNTSGNSTDANSSDTKNYLLNEERVFPNNVWNSQTPEVFEINVTDADAYYTIVFAVAIDTAVYRYDNFPFYANIFTPDGAHRHLSPSFPVKQYDRWKGEVRDGYHVISKQLYEYFPFSKAGKQRIEVKQATSQFNLEGVHAFYISIKKADLDFDKMRNE